MSIDLTEQTTSHEKQRSLRSELFTKGLFEERDLPPQDKNAKTHREVKCLNCDHKPWLRKIGDSSTTNLWRHLEAKHPDKYPKEKKERNLEEGQSTLDAFVGQADVQLKVSNVININIK
jgi:hypothetical protein